MQRRRRRFYFSERRGGRDERTSGLYQLVATATRLRPPGGLRLSLRLGELARPLVDRRTRGPRVPTLGGVAGTATAI
jgi:hypothetical protein